MSRFILPRHLAALSSALLLVFLVPVSALASTIVRTGESVSVALDQRVEGDFYFITSSGSIQGSVTGDVVAAAGSLTITGEQGADILLLAGTVNIGETASVTDDVRIIGGDVVVAGTIKGSLVVIGNSLRLLSTGSVGGDVFFMGREMVLEGSVGGQVLGQAEAVRLDGLVSAGVDVTTPELVLGERANVTGDVRYASQNELTRAPGAVVTGTIVHGEVVAVGSAPFSYRSLAISFLVSVFASVSLFLVIRRPLTRFAEFSVNRFGLYALLGAALLVLLPMIITILLISVLGAFLGFIGLAIFLLLLIISIPLINIVLAACITKVLLQKVEINLIWITVAAALVQGLLFIPIIGPVAIIVLVLATIGAGAAGIYHALRVM